MKIKREVLLKQLEVVSPGLASKEIIEQSSHFVFQDGKVITFDDEISCTGNLSLEVTGAIQGKPLLELLRKLQESEIDITHKDGELIIKGKGRRAGIRMESE